MLLPVQARRCAPGAPWALEYGTGTLGNGERALQEGVLGIVVGGSAVMAFQFKREALGLVLFGFLLVGCGGTRNGALPQGIGIEGREHQASSHDLVYAITSKGIVVLSYPSWSIVARIPGYRNWYGVCSDPKNGNVFAITGNRASSHRLTTIRVTCLSAPSIKWTVPA